MVIELDETIAAIASPPGPAERGIIRISGANVERFVALLFRSHSPTNDWMNRSTAARIEGELQIPSLPVAIPAALMLWPTVRSYTGQPMAELHTIGAPPLLDAILERLTECGVRLAGRGEFTMRAFLAGRMDLVQAEAVLGVIDATDHHELEAALIQLGGGITNKLASVRGQMLSLLGDLEAGLDFVEEDIEFISADQIVQRLQDCQAIVADLVSDSADRLPSGYRSRVVLAGLPNAGKSTLFNRLMGSHKAIVSAIAGTTRDYLTGIAACGALEVELVDTAGWEAASDLIMQNAQQARNDQISRCDLVVWCTAADLSTAARSASDRLLLEIVDSGTAVLPVATRCDLQPDQTSHSQVTSPTQTQPAISIHADEDAGLQRLRDTIRTTLSDGAAARSELLSTTAARCRSALNDTSTCITAAIELTRAQAGDEIISIELREALQQIGVVLGDVYTDDILDHIFRNFCIGK